jgi:putative nucleotidyltransferase with HDIG domain
MSTAQTQFARRLFSQIHLFGYIGLGVAALLWTMANWHSSDPLRLVSFALATVFGSMLKLRLPGVHGMVSVSALFILVGIVNLTLPEALLVGALSMLVQCTWRTSARPKLVQTAFNISVLAIAVFIAVRVFDYSHRYFLEPVSLGLVALAYFCANTFPIAVIIGLTEGQSIFKVWKGNRWLLPYYVAGASLAWLISTLPRGIQWEFPIICLPLVYLVHRSNRGHLAQMEQERTHMAAMNGLHLRTIEALALAIDAKDHTTHDHLQRVQLYAVEIGKDLGLSEQELEALTAAAVLHDIGKLAVPESIISKPGKLTRSEFEKMKIHPVVGAEILERVEFPYPVVPIVRSHHEKWDGSGYPHGLKGSEIPIGARILAVVDCLDALASDRQYRRALPLDEAMARVALEAGTAFDPAIASWKRALSQPRPHPNPRFRWTSKSLAAALRLPAWKRKRQWTALLPRILSRMPAPCAGRKKNRSRICRPRASARCSGKRPWRLHPSASSVSSLMTQSACGRAKKTWSAQNSLPATIARSWPAWAFHWARVWSDGWPMLASPS